MDSFYSSSVAIIYGRLGTSWRVLVVVGLGLEDVPSPARRRTSPATAGAYRGRWRDFGPRMEAKEDR